MKPIALKIRYFFYLLPVVLLLSACDQSFNSDQDSRLELLNLLHEQRSQVLVDSEWLADYAYYPDVHILELGRSRNEFEQGHIPGAKHIDWQVDITDPEQPERYVLPPQEVFEQLMSRLGISSGSSIVLYDSMSNRAAVRMYWTLKYYMHDSVKVLDGGLTAWQQAGYSLSDEPVKVEEQSQYQVESLNERLLADSLYVFSNLQDRRHSLVDARPFTQFIGQEPGKVSHRDNYLQRLGHISGAHSVPWEDHLQMDGAFKSTEDLLALYAAHDIHRENTLITYANDGLDAAMPWFVLHELLGYQDVRLYDGSLVEWADREDRPMSTEQFCL